MLHKLRERVQDEKGFTLIELLVVILIIGILAAIALPAFLNQREKAQDSEAKSAARTVQTAMETYYTDNQSYANLTKAELILRKGFRPGIDSYSFFFENDRKTPTGLAGYLAECGINTVTLVGLATDYCVAYSALDAARLGFNTTVRLDCCRAIDLDGSLEKMLGKMRDAGVKLV